LTPETTPEPSSELSDNSRMIREETEKLGKAVVHDVLGPVIDRLSGTKGRDGAVDAKESEALAMIRKGFEDLVKTRPELGWKVVEGLLEGINE